MSKKSSSMVGGRPTTGRLAANYLPIRSPTTLNHKTKTPVTRVGLSLPKTKATAGKIQPVSGASTSRTTNAIRTSKTTANATGNAQAGPAAVTDRYRPNYSQASKKPETANRTYTKKELEQALDARRLADEAACALPTKSNEHTAKEEPSEKVKPQTTDSNDDEKMTAEYSLDFESSYESDFEEYEGSLSDLTDSHLTEDEELLPSSASSPLKKDKPESSSLQTNEIARNETASRNVLTARSRPKVDYFDFKPRMQANISARDEKLASSNDTVMEKLDGVSDLQPDSFRKDIKTSKFNRTKTLSKLITLQKVGIEIHQEPEVEYRHFMRLFGKRNQRQMAVQTPDKTNQAIQVDQLTPEKEAKGIQKPDSDQNRQVVLDTMDIFHLSQFLLVAEQMLRLLLTPVPSPSTTPQLEEVHFDPQRSSVRMQSSVKQSLSLQAKVSLVEWGSDCFITVHQIDSINEKLYEVAASIITLWPKQDARNQTYPLRAFRCRCNIRQILHIKSWALIALTDSNQLDFYDLTRPSLMISDPFESWFKSKEQLRTQTECVAVCTRSNHTLAHQTDIVRLMSMPDTCCTLDLDDQKGQMVSVDRSGKMIVWQMTVLDGVRGSESDFELLDDCPETIGSDLICVTFDINTRLIVQLHRIIDLHDSLKEKSRQEVQIVAAESLSDALNSFLVAFSDQSVMLIKCDSNETANVKFESNFGPISIRSIRMHPTIDRLFAVTTTENVLSIYSCQSTSPIDSVYLSEGSTVQWCPSPNSALIAVLDHRNRITFFDLCDGLQRPLFQFEVQTETEIDHFSVHCNKYSSQAFIITKDQLMIRVQLDKLFGRPNVRQWISSVGKVQM